MNKESGFTMVEFLVAIVILLIGMLGLLQAANVALNSNQQNHLRNEATLVMDNELGQELAKGYAGASVLAHYTCEHRKLLNAYVNYSVVRSGTQYPNSKEIRFRISWPYRAARYSYNGGGIISNSVVAQ